MMEVTYDKEKGTEALVGIVGSYMKVNYCPAWHGGMIGELDMRK